MHFMHPVCQSGKHHMYKIAGPHNSTISYSLLGKLVPIMLWSNAPKFCLLCSNYAPYVSQYSPQIQPYPT